MTDYNQPLEKHCDGCDEPRLDVKRYGFVTPEGEKGIANWCNDCATMAAFDGPVGAAAGGNYDVYELPEPDPDIRPGGKHSGDPWCDPSAR